MSQPPTSTAVTPAAKQLSVVALVLAVLAIPGVTLTWDIADWGGFAIGVPLALAAIVVGVLARRRSGGAGNGVATAAIVIGVLCLALVVVWGILETAGVISS